MQVGRGGRRVWTALGRALILAVAGALAALLALTALWTVAPPVSTLMLARYATAAPVTRTYAPLDHIAPALAAAVILSEDARFCAHAGVDWKAIGEVLEEADEDGPARGASTIAMQVAKNLFLWPSRSALRKGLEIPLALGLDLVWPKRRMLEVYLNIAEWGPNGVFGAEAAARARFGKSARALTPLEAALLAKTLPNPLARNPARPSAGLLRLSHRLAAQLPTAAALVECLGEG